MFGISGTELMIILFFGFLIFGPEKLPQMGRTVGRAIRQFKDASEAANKKFKEQVADPFQDAIAPYKDQMEESAKPLQEDIAAINSTLNETKSMFTDPFKDIFSPTQKKPDAEKVGAVISTGVAVDDAASSSEASDAGQDGIEKSSSPTDEIAGSDESSSSPQASGSGREIPDNSGTVKKSLAASLYDLDEDEDGE